MMIQSLDFKSLLFMSALLAFSFSVLLLATRARIATLHGLMHWVGANLFIGSAVLIFISETLSLATRALCGGLSIVIGLSLYFIALSNFEEYRQGRKLIKKPLIVVVMINVLLAIFLKNQYHLIIFNTAICVVLSAMSAILLLKSHQRSQRSIEQIITGISFATFASFTAYRLYVLTLDKINPIHYLTQWPYNEITFLVCMLTLLIINFAFIAMVNVKIAAELTHAAGHDWLTGIMNRRRFEESFAVSQASSVRYGYTQSMLLLDLDNFKDINDQYGHLFGDKVIKTFAHLVKEAVREVDILGRYGGEEFCIVMPNTNEADALILAERIRSQYETTSIWLGSKRIPCTVSIGVCDSSKIGNDFKSLFEAADQSLYAAKKAGKNAVVAHSNLLLS